jgi:hypothetical protein
MTRNLRRKSQASGTGRAKEWTAYRIRKARASGLPRAPWMCVRSGRIPLVGTQNLFRRKHTLHNALLSRREGVPEVDLVKAKQGGLRMLKMHT